jgi:hypothetical protein
MTPSKCNTLLSLSLLLPHLLGSIWHIIISTQAALQNTCPSFAQHTLLVFLTPPTLLSSLPTPPTPSTLHVKDCLRSCPVYIHSLVDPSSPTAFHTIYFLTDCSNPHCHLQTPYPTTYLACPLSHGSISNLTWPSRATWFSSKTFSFTRLHQSSILIALTLPSAWKLSLNLSCPISTSCWFHHLKQLESIHFLPLLPCYPGVTKCCQKAKSGHNQFLYIVSTIVELSRYNSDYMTCNVKTLALHREGHLLFPSLSTWCSLCWSFSATF